MYIIMNIAYSKNTIRRKGDSMHIRIPLEEIWEGLEKHKHEVESGWLMRRVGYDGADCHVIFIKEQNQTYFGVKHPEGIKKLLQSKYDVLHAKLREDHFVLVEMRESAMGYDILETIDAAIGA